MTATTDTDVLAGARELVRAGVPVFVARPALDDDGQWNPTGGTGGTGYHLPRGWEHTRPDELVLDQWRPGWAVAGVMGHGLDLVDIDPRSGGDESLGELDAGGLVPTVYANAATPSGGEHLFVASMDVRSRDAVRPGLDIKAGTRRPGPDGRHGRGFAFIAPTVKLSKTTGELAAYSWTVEPDAETITLEALDDDTGQVLAEMVRAAHGSNGTTHTGTSEPFSGPAGSPWDDVPGLLAQGRHKAVHALASALRGRGGWRVEDAVEYMRAVVWPHVDQDQGGHPYDWSEFEADVRDVFTRYDDGGEQRRPEGADDPPQEPEQDDPVLDRFMTTGGAFILDAPTTIPAVWGQGDVVLWAEGEPLLIAAPPGVGKTTLAGQLLHRTLFGGHLLEQPVQPTSGKVLYLAMDRPRQIARALRRHFTEADRVALDERLVVWAAPPPADMAKNPRLLLHLARRAGASVVFIDSIKDAAVGLSDDEVGSGYNRAVQFVIAEGIEVAELHHLVKRGSDGKAPRTLADVYGSAWITAGAGSVIVLNGEAGDLIVEARHLKQPGEPFGPVRLLHDHAAGTTVVYHQVDPLRLAQLNPAGLTAKQLASAVHETDKPTKNQVERARRRLAHLVDQGFLTTTTAPSIGGTATVYVPADGVQLGEAVVEG